MTPHHIVALVGGSVAAVATIVGMFVLISRRATNSRVRSATTRNDVFMYVVLVLVILAGTAATLIS